MIKQEEINKAYEEFKNYWDGLGFPEASDRYVRLAFNEGYKAAKQSKLVVVKSIEVDVDRDTKKDAETDKLIKEDFDLYAQVLKRKLNYQEQLSTKTSGKKHYPNGRNKRSSKVVSDDNYKVSEYLKELGVAVPLSLIVMHMNKTGRKHWNTNNASAFMRLMIKDKYPVVKVSHGVYKYKKGDNQC